MNLGRHVHDWVSQATTSWLQHTTDLDRGRGEKQREQLRGCYNGLDKKKMTVWIRVVTVKM